MDNNEIEITNTWQVTIQGRQFTVHALTGMDALRIVYVRYPEFNSKPYQLQIIHRLVWYPAS
jgi:hypothetical protein